MALEQKKKPLPPWLANVKPSPTLTFRTLKGTFVENHVSKVPVTVTVVQGWFGTEALIFRAPLNEDIDGHPRTYAPPISDTNHNPLPGLSPLDHINNATNEIPPTFRIWDPKNPVATRNSWVWAGVKHMPGNANGRRVDDRPFLRDHNGDFPVFNRAGDNEQF